MASGCAVLGGCEAEPGGCEVEPGGCPVKLGSCEEELGGCDRAADGASAGVDCRMRHTTSAAATTTITTPIPIATPAPRWRGACAAGAIRCVRTTSAPRAGVATTPLRYPRAVPCET